jgi:hypothetical protein
MAKNNTKKISQYDRYKIIRIIGMSISGLAILAAFSALLGLHVIEQNYEKFMAGNEGSLLFRYVKYILYIQIGLSVLAMVSSFFFMLHNAWAKNLLIKTIWGFFLFYIFMGIVLVFDANRNLDFKNISSFISILLPLCIVLFMMRYIYIYLVKLLDKINSEKISGLFK